MSYCRISSETPDALYGGFDREQRWYTWEGDYETGRYRPIEVPNEYQRTFGFGIG